MKKILLVLLLITTLAKAQYQKRIDSLTRALSTAADDIMRQNILGDLAWEYSESQPTKALVYANQQLELASRTGVQEQLAAAFNTQGAVHEGNSDYAVALDYFMKSLKLYEDLKDSAKMASVLANAGNLYSDQKQYDIALSYYLRALKIQEKRNPNAKLGTTYNNIGLIYKNKKEYAKALDYYQKSLALRLKYSSKRDIGSSYNNIGSVYAALHEYDKAMASFEKALEIRREINDLNGIAGTNINIGKLHNTIKKYREALPFLQEGLKYAHLADFKQWRLNAYGNIVDSYEGLKDFENEVIYLQKYINLNDSLFSEEQSAQIADMREKYEAEKKEAENIELNQQNMIQSLELTKNKYLLYGSLILLLLVVAIALLALRQSRLKASQKSMELEQKLLRSQMNPHFIFNSLTAIESYIYKNNPKEAGKYLSSFARLMRLILENSREEYIVLSKEIKTLEYYLELQKNRFDDRFDYEITIGEDIDPDVIAIPPMLAQPFIENSIEHGVKDLDEKGQITVRFHLEGEQLIFEVADNGIGLEGSRAAKEKLQTHISMATVITGERLQNLNKGKKNKIRLLTEDIKDADNRVLGTHVLFAIPYKEI